VGILVQGIKLLLTQENGSVRWSSVTSFTTFEKLVAVIRDAETRNSYRILVRKPLINQRKTEEERRG
jgi:hypothetical protein